MRGGLSGVSDQGPHYDESAHRCGLRVRGFVEGEEGGVS